MTQEKIKAAAIFTQLGIILTLPPPARHYHIMQWCAEDRGISLVGSTQGFILTSGKFVDRETAYKIAEQNDQIKNKPLIEGTLHTEDLW